MSEETGVAAVDALVARAQRAQAAYEANGSQALYRTAALAAAWALMDPARNQELAQMAVEVTGLGNVADKITKNHRKTLGLLRDVIASPTFGVIKEEPELGITQIARAKGVVGAVVPSTNPVATPVNNIVNALICGNAIILSPSPRGGSVCEALLAYIYAEFDKVGVDRDLVQMLPSPSSKEKTQRLMESVDLLVVTGSQDNVRRAYSSGTPALAVGAGNVSVIVDETADLTEAATKISASKCFDNATSCSSENALIVVDAVYDACMQALHEAGGRLLDQKNAQILHQAMFASGKLNRHLIASDIDVLIDATNIHVEDPASAKFLILPAQGIGPEYPESSEKLSRILSLYRAADFDAAIDTAGKLLAHVGAGHSVGLHSCLDKRARRLAQTLPTCRVIVNQAHCFATGGAFNNGMPFSLSMGCGSWGGNVLDDNLNFRHFMNISRVIRQIPPVEPSVDEVFSAYWKQAGQ